MQRVFLSVLAALTLAVSLPVASAGLPVVDEPCDEGDWAQRAQCIVDNAAGPVIDLALDIAFYAVDVALDAYGQVVGIVWAVYDIAMGFVGFVVTEAMDLCHEAVGSVCDFSTLTICWECLIRSDGP